MPYLVKPGLLLTLVWLMLSPGMARADEPTVVRAVFDTDPQWDGFRNRMRPANPPRVRQDLGYQTTQRAGGVKAGEIGGRVQRSPEPAFYALPIPARSLDERLSALCWANLRNSA